MKPQVSTKTIMLATAVVAIACCGAIWLAAIMYPIAHRVAGLNHVLQNLIFESPMWVPLVFAAFVIGRRRISVAMVLAFAAAEESALVVAKVVLFSVRGY